MSIDKVVEEAAEVQVISSTPRIVILSSSENLRSFEGDDMEWTDKDVLDFDDVENFESMDAGEAVDLGIS